MNSRVIKTYVFLAACFGAVAIAPELADQKIAASENEISIGEIRDYRKMFRVNEKPLDMVESTKVMCAPPWSVFGPHYDPGVVYYINEIARQGVKTFPGDKSFPAGSIIVKEKQERKTADSVQIITVMKKIRDGRSEDSWQYKMFDVAGWKEIGAKSQASSSDRTNCIGCHRQYRENDYVSDKGIELLLGKSKERGE